MSAMHLRPFAARRTYVAEPKLRLHRRGHCSGTTMIELLVAFSLLIAVLSAALPLVVRHGRLLSSARQYRLALDEVSTQLDRLTALPLDVVQEEIDALAVSEFTNDRLAGAKLSGEVQPTEWGQRLTLSLVWREPQRAAAPVQLAGWIFNGDAHAESDESDEGDDTADDVDPDRGQAFDDANEEGQPS
jgi:Tfp pilus assembly protein PilV